MMEINECIAGFTTSAIICVTCLSARLVAHVSLMLKQGIHPKIVKKRLGHSNIQITLDTYSHIAPGLQEAAAAKFEEL